MKLPSNVPGKRETRALAMPRATFPVCAILIALVLPVAAQQAHTTNTLASTHHSPIASSDSALTTSTPSATTPAPTTAELEARIRTILRETRTPGFTGAIVYGDNVIWQGAIGIANLATNHPVTTSTQFRIGSISKMFISLAVLRLVEQGRVSLDVPLRQLVPEIGIKNPWEETDPVRLVHVLEHTSGFDDIRFRDYGNPPPGNTLLQGLRNNIGSKHSRWRPGTRAAYSNIGPPTAALAVEQLSGIPFADFATSVILTPVGMRGASYAPGPDLAVSHHYDGSPVPYSKLPVRPGGALNVTSDDMIRLLRFFHGRGSIDGRTILTSASIDRMERPASLLAARAGIRVGRALGNIATVRDGFLFQGHTGGIENFSSAFSYLPSHQRGYYFSINGGADRAFDLIEKEIIAFITRGLKPVPPPPVVSLSEQEFNDIEGVYQPDSATMALKAAPMSLVLQTIRRHEGVLRAGSPVTGYKDLKPVGNNLFLVGNEPIPSLAFVRTPEGDLLAQSHALTFRRVPAFLAYGRLILIALSVPVLLSTLFFAPVWLIRKFSGRLHGVPHLSLRVLPFLGTLVLLLSFAMAKGAGSPQNLGSFNIWSVGYFIGTLLVALLAAMAVVNLIFRWKHRHQVNRLTFIHSTAATIAILILTLFLAHSGLLALRTWAY